MTMTLRSTLALAACVALMTSPAQAQGPLERQLADGRILTAPSQVDGCETPMVTGNDANALGLEYVCQVSATDAAEPTMTGVGVVLLTRPMAGPSQAFLVRFSRGWWAETTPETRAERVVVQSKMIGDEPTTLECIHRDGEDGPTVIVCVMQGETIQFMVSGRSTDLASAEKGMDKVLAGLRLRPSEPAPESAEVSTAPPAAAN